MYKPNYETVEPRYPQNKAGGTFLGKFRHYDLWGFFNRKGFHVEARYGFSELAVLSGDGSKLEPLKEAKRRVQKIAPYFAMPSSQNMPETLKSAQPETFTLGSD